jgi:hypothetical protein
MEPYGIARVWGATDLLIDVRAMVTEMNRTHYRYATPATGATCQYDADLTGKGAGHRCIVGEWLARQGVDMDALNAWERAVLGGEAHVTDTSITTVYGADGPRIALPNLSRDALSALASVQSGQDFGDTWGEAIDSATERLEWARD